MSDILVSINCITYNHEKYIADALDSFLMQKTDFKYEILVHDDASTDETPMIIKDYELKYPDLIKPIYQIENQYSKGVRVSSVNLKRARGKYVALCEGDDYWIDPLKLQKQVDYMESHPECSMCTHAAYVVSRDKRTVGTMRPSKSSRIFSTEDIIFGGGGFLPTNSLLYRSLYINEFPGFYHNAPVGDYPLAIFLSLKGVVYYMDQFMSSYRRGVEGSQTSELGKSSNPDKLKKHIYRMIKMFDEINDYTNYTYHDLIERRKAYNEFFLIEALNDYKKLEEMEFRQKFKLLPLNTRLRIYLKYHTPWMVRTLKNLRSIRRR